MNEPKTKYTLTCDKCGRAFTSLEAFPSPLLCPQCLEPDENRLLTMDEIKANPAYNEYLKTMNYGEAQRACQRDLTASILKQEWAKLVIEAYDKGYDQKDRECQQRVEGIFREIEKHIDLTKEGEQIVAIGEDSHLATRTYDWWQALKKQEGVK